MRVAIFQTKNLDWSRYLLSLVATGVQSVGDIAIEVHPSHSRRYRFPPFDVGVQLCFANKMDQDLMGGFRMKVAKECYHRRIRLLTLDTGFVRNQMEYLNDPSQPILDIANPKTYWPAMGRIQFEVGFDGLKRGADYCVPEPPPPDRWLKLQTPLRPWRQKGAHILLIGQTVHGISTQDINVYDWYGKALQELRRYTDRPVVFRQHPRLSRLKKGNPDYLTDRKNFKSRSAGISNMSRSSGGPIEQDLEKAWAAIVLTSNAGVTAAIHGIPVFALNPLCMAWDVANHSLETIEDPIMPDREAWAYRLAYSQWTGQELRDGQAWRYFRTHASRPPKPLINILEGYL